MTKPASLVTLQCGATASEAPEFHYIPIQALIRLAKRFADGAKKHEPFGWMRGLVGRPSLPPRPSPEVEYMLARSNHVIFHALKFQAKLQGLLPQDGDDDAAAIMWGGAVLSELQAAMEDILEK